MFKSYLVKNIPLMEDIMITYIKGSEYTLVMTTEEIPSVDCTISTGVMKPIVSEQTYPNAYIYTDDENETISVMRSNLTYLTSELLSPVDFYWGLDYDVDRGETRREVVFKLHYRGIPVRVEDEGFLENFKEMKYGPLIASSNSFDGPVWYNSGLFDDLASGEKNLQSVFGKNATYLLYRSSIPYDDELALGDIEGVERYMASGLFPSNTSEDIVMNKRLERLNNGQYSMTLRTNLPPLATYYEGVITLSIPRLFWLLVWLKVCPTWNWLKRELQIWLLGEEAQINYRTKYLPDAMRMDKLSTMRDVGAEVLSTNGEAPLGSTSVSFFDERSGLDVTLYIALYIAEVMEVEEVAGESLRDRYESDTLVLLD